MMRATSKQVYWIWSAMVQRCTNPKVRQWKDYGGRGIAVCDRWRRFENFYEDMGERPVGMSLDRINNNLGYEPGNCRWATRLEQASNKRNCIYIIDAGAERVSLAEYCRRHNLPYRPVVKRIQDRGWPIEMAVTLPIGRVKDGQHIEALWNQCAELRNYLSVLISAVEGAPVSERLIDEAKILCDLGTKIALRQNASA